MKNRNVFFYIFIGLSLAAVIALVFVLAPGRLPGTPAVLLPTPAPAESIGSGDSAAPGAAINVTPVTVQSALATLDRADCYSRSLQVKDFWSDGSRSRSIEIFQKGSMLRLNIAEEGNSQKHILLLDGQKWLWYDDDPAVYTGPAAENDADRYQTVISYEDILNVPTQDILDAGFTEFGGVSCIFVRWRYGTLGYESECYIDPVTGLLMGERSYDGKVLLYSMDSTAPEFSVPDEALFVPPAG